MTRGDPSNRKPDPSTEAGLPEKGPGRDHVPYAQMDKEQAEKEAPEVSDHASAGQGLSG